MDLIFVECGLESLQLTQLVRLGTSLMELGVQSWGKSVMICAWDIRSSLSPARDMYTSEPRNKQYVGLEDSWC